MATKIKLTVEFEVDETEWAKVYGIPLQEVKADAHNYSAEQLVEWLQSSAIEPTEIAVTRGRGTVLAHS